MNQKLPKEKKRKEKKKMKSKEVCNKNLFNCEYLRLVMIIADEEPTAAASYIMSPSLCVKNMSIKIKSLLFPFLKICGKAFRKKL